jgi:NADH-quinone oxidoreductase subunit M
MLGLVSLTLFLPLIGMVLLLLLPAGQRKLIHATAITTGVLTFIGSLILWSRGWTSGVLSQIEQVNWIPSISASYKVGIDGISLPLVVLTTLLFLAVYIYSANTTKRPKAFAALLLFLETASLGVFLSSDMLLFYVFFELTLVGMYFIISGWGHGEKAKRAALMFFIYTLLGSLPLLLAILALYFGTTPHTFDMQAIIANPPLAGGIALFALIAILVSFGIKTPVVPFHSWLPVAHVDAPTVGSVILAGVMLKIGTYGLIRFGLQMVPGTFQSVIGLIVVIVGVVSVIYGSFAALAQTDIKRMIAYTSVGHMGYIVMAIGAAAVTTNPAIRALALDGAVLQMVSHGIVTSLLFFLAGMIQERTKTREIPQLKGLLIAMPLLSGLFMFAAFASMGIPGLAHFPAELQTFLGTFAVYPVAASIALVGVLIVSGMYIRVIRLVFWGKPKEQTDASASQPLSLRELATVLPLAALTLVIGIAPALILTTIHASTILIGT